MKPGDLDRRITIQRATSTMNNFNEPVEIWADYVAVAAKRRDASDGERFAAGQVGSSLTTRFTVRHSPKTKTVNAKDRIVHEGDTYSIHGVKEAAEGRYRFFEITAAKDAD